MNELDDYIANLENLKKEVFECGKRLCSEKLTLMDIYCITVLNRTFNILCGFIDLMKSDNFTSAAPLTRIQIDSLLRLYAVHLTDNKNEFLEKVIDGVSINKLKSRDNKLLTDSYLATEISKFETFKWVERIYKAGNSFIHLTDKHLISSFRATDRKNTVTFSIGGNFVPINEKIGLIGHMENITKGILLFVDTWTENKNNVC